MFDIGWTELLVIASVAIIVVGPKDLPRMLRTLGQTLGKVRRMSREFQSTFNDALKEAEQQADIADMKKQVEDAGNFNPLGDLKKSIEEDMAKVTDTVKPYAAKTESSKNSKTASVEAKGADPAPEPQSDKAAETETPAAETADTAKETSGKSLTEDVKA